MDGNDLVGVWPDTTCMDNVPKELHCTLAISHFSELSVVPTSWISAVLVSELVVILLFTAIGKDVICHTAPLSLIYNIGSAQGLV